MEYNSHIFKGNTLFDLRRTFGQLRALTRWVLYYASMYIDYPSIALIWDMSLSTLSASFILKKDAQLVRQRPYRHSPVPAAKVKREIDKLVLAGILRRFNSNWTGPLVVIV